MPRFLNLISCCILLFLSPVHEVLGQVTATLTPGQTYNGTLSSTDPATDDGRHIQCFNLDVSPNQEITLTLVSSHFDTFLFAGPGRCAGQLQLNLSNDDAEPGSTDAQLRFTATQNDYAFVVTSSRAGETGSYTLNVEGESSPTNANGNGDEAVNLMDWVLFGRWPPEVPEDLILGSALGDTTVEHTIQLTEPASLYISGRVPSYAEFYLTLVTSDGTEIPGRNELEDDWFYEDSVTARNLPVGTYQIRVEVYGCDNAQCHYYVDWSGRLP